MWSYLWRLLLIVIGQFKEVLGVASSGLASGKKLAEHMAKGTCQQVMITAPILPGGVSRSLLGGKKQAALMGACVDAHAARRGPWSPGAGSSLWSTVSKKRKSSVPHSEEPNLSNLISALGSGPAPSASNGIAGPSRDVVCSL